MRDLLSDLSSNARQIAKHGKRADQIVKNMMEHAQGGSGDHYEVALNKLVEEYVTLAYQGKRTQLPELQVDIARTYDEAVGGVEMAPQEMGRVLLNLLGNALDAVHEKGSKTGNGYRPQVTVATRRTQGSVEIRVRDNGPGIPEHIKEKIFEPFFTTKPTGSGTGLGLSLSYDIITQGHGGTLTVESTEGEGATFVVSLPT
jgi:signal transduction histidine kinase